MRRRSLWALIVLLVAVGAAACTNEEAGPIASDGSDQASLEGRSFISQNVAGHDLVPGTEIRLTFKDGNIGAQAGCNSLGAPYELKDNVLVIRAQGMQMTEIGCDQPRHDQDDWLADFLMSSPTVELSRAALTLASGLTTIELRDREVVDPDRPLVGTTWRVDTVFSGDSASSVPERGDVTLEFPTDTTFRVSARDCTSASRTMVVEGDNITFDDFARARIACPAPWEETIAVLDVGEVAYSIDAGRLTIMAGDIGFGAIAEP